MKDGGLRDAPPLTVSRILAVGGPAASAPPPVGARAVDGVAALVRQVAPLPLIGSRAPGAVGGHAVPHPHLPQLLVNLEPLQPQLFHFLCERVNTLSIFI